MNIPPFFGAYDEVNYTFSENYFQQIYFIFSNSYHNYKKVNT